ncbi:MAG TPA: UDP-3-O-(3-hydroxymyristoyl)glucosamine N-acyltransferase, partial [Planctomycetota bacterium]|nr:UDP-3-O-(3-hydroxymyristoyl)glucosamine N-acyltransferase [Planctomycetota bacterium]
APFTDEKFLPDLQKTRAGAILAKSDACLPNVPQSTALLCAADPEIAFIQLIHALHPEASEPAGVDSRAVVEPGAVLGANVSIGPFAVIRAGTHIGPRTVVAAHAVIGRKCVVGEDSRIMAHVVLYDGTRVGSRTIIHSGTVIGADGFGYKFRAGRHVKVPQIGIVEIGDDVEIGANTCIDRGALNPTRIGNGTKIDNLVQIGHGARVGNHCILCGQAAIAGSSGMDDYAVLGGNAGIADHVFMGKGAKAGAKSGVGKFVPPGQEVFGIFAEERKTAMRQLAAMRRLPDLIERVRELEKRLSKFEGKPEA